MIVISQHICYRITFYILYIIFIYKFYVPAIPMACPCCITPVSIGPSLRGKPIRLWHTCLFMDGWLCRWICLVVGLTNSWIYLATMNGWSLGLSLKRLEPFESWTSCRPHVWGCIASYLNLDDILYIGDEIEKKKSFSSCFTSKKWVHFVANIHFLLNNPFSFMIQISMEP